MYVCMYVCVYVYIYIYIYWPLGLPSLPLHRQLFTEQQQEPTSGLDYEDSESTLQLGVLCMPRYSET